MSLKFDTIIHFFYSFIGNSTITTPLDVIVNVILVGIENFRSAEKRQLQNVKLFDRKKMI